MIAGIDFEDVNSDGYTDMVVNTGGTMNETHDLYIWDNSSKMLTKAIYDGFDMLSYFEVHDGYLMNWVKASANGGVIQKLVWNGNTLTKVSEESYGTGD
ncbi:MAG: hypothetical protein FWF49_03535 [Oscillospiraceae bacterium]|nr:hypothetical protein [Oscillospiraceae bacterium]